MKKSNSEKKDKNTGAFSTTLLIVLIALVSVSAATLAWFSVADSAKLSDMNFYITTGKSLRFSLDKHESFDEYSTSLSMEEIANRILSEDGVDIRTTPLEPLTTEDTFTFTNENGEVVNQFEGKYFEFTLHFMTTTDMKVHLTSSVSDKGEEGTSVKSSNEGTPAAMRISFTAGGKTKVFDPGLGNVIENNHGTVYFGLYPEKEMMYNDTNLLFEAPEGVDVPVRICVWLEGTDEACTNDIKESDYQIRLRFEGKAEEDRD